MYNCFYRNINKKDVEAYPDEGEMEDVVIYGKKIESMDLFLRRMREGDMIINICYMLTGGISILILNNHYLRANFMCKCQVLTEKGDLGSGRQL